MFLASGGHSLQRTETNLSDETEYATPPSSPDGLTDSGGSPHSMRTGTTTPPSSLIHDFVRVVSADGGDSELTDAKQLSWNINSESEKVVLVLSSSKTLSPSPRVSSSSDPLIHRFGTVVVRGGMAKGLPQSYERFHDIMDKHGIPFVFKPYALEQFSRLLHCRYALVLRRPAGFGVETFVSLISAWLDLVYDKHNDPFATPVEPNAPRNGLHTSYVLDLDFSCIRGTKDVAAKLCEYLSEQYRLFLDRYQLWDKIPWIDAKTDTYLDPSHYIKLLAEYIRALPPSRCAPLFVIIRHFDTLAYGGYVDGAKILNKLLYVLQKNVMARVVSGALLVSNRDDGTVNGCLGRGSPDVPLPCNPAAPYRVKLDWALDLSHHPAFQTAVGFTEDEIEDLDRVLGAALGSKQPPLIERVRAGHIWSAVFADEGWFAAQKTWAGNGQEMCGYDPAQWLRNLGREHAAVAVHPAQQVLALLSEKYGLRRT
ncbi:hypothetical protein HMN09_00892600 [Mycena chlorophos]|uniref:Uncharacterized protein n=1 Tax=Mycena chlorophos TaxID=658473 RepID=A0A8H6W4I3_MYCCL|nr:hypothetical protein HMN09_00892600 [Mycena chlorophos]